MIAPDAGLSVNRQCWLLGIARSSFYYQPQPASVQPAGAGWPSAMKWESAQS